MIRCALNPSLGVCWDAIPWFGQIGVLILVAVAAWNLIQFLRGAIKTVRDVLAAFKAWGGWPAVVGAVLTASGVIVALLSQIAAIWPKRGPAHDPFPHPDGEPVHPRQRKKKRHTIFDGLRK